MAPVSVLIPTFNEELNIEYAVQSVIGLSDDIVIMDSFSTDGTREIVERLSSCYQGSIRWIQHKFEGYGKQWNWAFDNIDWKYHWLILLAADERISPELLEEIEIWFESEEPSRYNAIFIKRRFIWQGKWIKHGGYYPFWDARLLKIGYGYFDERSVNEHLHIQGETRTFKNDIIHEDQRSLGFWIEKHNKYATLEAQELLRAEQRKSKDKLARFWGTQAERKRWIREKIWNRLLPLLIRPFLYFFYRYFIRLGFLDGKEGFVYHFLHGLWYRFLIDIKYLEMKHQRQNKNGMSL